MTQVSTINAEHSLDELATTANSAYRRLQSDVVSALSNALTIGEALLEARSKVEYGDWQRWLEDNVEFSQHAAGNYQRLAYYKEHIQQQTSITAALDTLRAFPDTHTRGRPAYPEYVRQEALRLRVEGMPRLQVAQQLGISHQAIASWELTVEERMHRNRVKQQKVRDARKALAEKTKREARQKAAAARGGALAESYSRVRLLLESIDQAIAETDDREVKAILRGSRDAAYKAEEKIAKALGTE